MDEALLDKRSATTCLTLFYGLYIFLFASLPLLCIVSSCFEHSFNLFAVFRGSLLPGWKDVWWLGFLVAPAYIIIFHRVYDQLRWQDFVSLCLPLPAWLFVTLAVHGGFKSMTNGLLLEPAIVMALTGAYFLVVPFSRRFPAVPRAMIGAGLLALILTGTVLVVLFIPATGQA